MESTNETYFSTVSLVKTNYRFLFFKFNIDLLDAHFFTAQTALLSISILTILFKSNSNLHEFNIIYLD